MRFHTRKWVKPEDLNANGIMDAGEPGIEAVEIILYELGADNQKGTADDIEIKRDTTSYSVTTLTLLTQQYPQYEFFFIMGMDSFIQLPLWYQWQSLFSLCHIALCQRPGRTIDTHSEMAKQLLLRQAYVSDNDQSKHGKIYRIDSQLIDISSTEIRQRLHQHTDTQSVLHPSTRAYIEQHQLYR